MAVTRFCTAFVWYQHVAKVCGDFFFFHMLEKTGIGKQFGITFKEIWQHFTSAVPLLPCMAPDSKLPRFSGVVLELLNLCSTSCYQ